MSHGAPEPTYLKKLKGNPAKENLNRSEPTPKIVPWLEPPAAFDEEHCKLWHALCRELKELDILATCDKFILERYVVLMMRWRACRDYLNKLQGGSAFTVITRYPDVTDGRGQIIRKGEVKSVRMIPEAKHILSLNTELMRIEDRFGLSPSARSRIVMPDAPPNDPFDDDF